MEFDLEFNKKREDVNCDSCGSDLKLEEQEMLYTETELVKTLKRDMIQVESLQQEVKQSNSKSSVQQSLDKLNGRETQVYLTAKHLGLHEQLNDDEGFAMCLFCGSTNPESNDDCDNCGRADWTGEVAENTQ
jgi:hypothetical protein